MNVIGYMKYFSATWFGILQQNKYSKEWDIELNRLLDTGEFRWHLNTLNGTLCTLNTGDSEIWVANRWYASGYLYFKAGKYIPTEERKRPSVKTLIRVHAIADELEKDLLNEVKKS